jgi:hypothetical protein
VAAYWQFFIVSGTRNWSIDAGELAAIFFVPDPYLRRHMAGVFSFVAITHFENIRLL